MNNPESEKKRQLFAASQVGSGHEEGVAAMSSSSAYSNVLLKSPVQPQIPVAPKRDYQNDSSSTNFSQTFNDVRDNVRRKDEASQRNETNQRAERVQRKDEKPARPVADKKSTPIENRKAATENINHKKSVKEANASEKNTDTDKARSADAQDKKISHKSTKAEDNKKDELSDVVVTSNLNQDESTNTVIPTELAVVASIDDVNSEAIISGSAVALTSDVATDAVGIDPQDSTLASQNSIPTNAVPPELSQLNAAATIANEAKTAVASDVIADAEKALLNNENIASVALASNNVTANKTPAEVAQAIALGLAATNPSTQNPVGNLLAGDSSETAEDVLDTLMSGMSGTNGSDKTITKSAKDVVTPDISAKTDAQLAVQQDSKSVFEKMLQTVARAGGQEESASVIPAQNSTSNSHHSLLDSFARFSDAQTPAARSFVVQTAIPVPVGQPQWSQAVGEKVLWLAAQNVSSAEINLHPKDLGPMQVKVSVNQEQTSVSFTSHHPMVREVLDQNLNRLRDMFSEQGLNLVNVDVSDKSFSRQQGEAKDQKGQASANGVTEEEAVTAMSSIIQQRLVDHYA